MSGPRKMIRQKHAKRKSQTECEIYGQIHKVNYGELSRDKEKQRGIGRESTWERAERLGEKKRVAQPPQDLKNRKNKQQWKSTKESESICCSPEEVEGLKGEEGATRSGGGTRELAFQSTICHVCAIKQECIVALHTCYFIHRGRFNYFKKSNIWQRVQTVVYF